MDKNCHNKIGKSKFQQHGERDLDELFAHEKAPGTCRVHQFP